MNRFLKAKWIAPNKEYFPELTDTQKTVFDSPKNFTCFIFSKTIKIKQKCQLSIKISADVFYIFKLNGKIITRGPAIVGGEYGRKESLPWRFYDEFTTIINDGCNFIEILVCSSPIVMADYSSGQVGLILEATDSNNNCLFFTDNSWDCCIDKSFVCGNYTDLNLTKTNGVKSVEINRKSPINSGLKQLIQKTIKPVEVSKTENGFLFDFGKVYAAYIRTTVTASSQSIIAINPQEVKGLTNYGERILTKVGTATTESLQLHCMRYLEIITEAPVELDVELIYTHYPTENLENFICSDDNLNKLHKICKRTLKLCMQTYHLDSPVHQEALGCTGDYFIESLINYYTFGVTELTRLDILRTAWLMQETDGKLFHTTYSLIWVQWLLDFYNYTGDRELLFECEHSLNLLLKRFDGYCINGLIENPPDYLFIDWILIDEFDLHHPPKNLGQSALNCFYYKALLCASEIKRLLNKQLESEQLKAKADHLKTIFNQTFWDEENGLYFGGKNDFINTNIFLPISNEKRYFTIHANTLAVLYGLAENGENIMEKVINNDLFHAQPYFWHYIFEALYSVNLFEKYAFKCFDLWKQLLNECDSSLKEIYHPAGFTCDYSHGWGGTPAYQLSSKVLGVKFKDGKPTFCEPILGPLNFANGIIPLCDGKKLKVEIFKTNGGTKRNVTIE